MEQEVYVDLYFLINTSMDLLGLLLTASLLHRRLPRWRGILAACLGGLYAVTALLLFWSGGLGFAFDCLAAILMILVAFPSKKEGRLWKKALYVLKITAVYLLVSMLLGGVMTALYSALNRLELPFDAMQGEGLSVWIFALITLLSGLVTARGGRFLGLSQKTKSVKIQARIFGRSISLCALVDSGNLLRDPISGKGVIVADLAALSPALPVALRRAVESGRFEEWLSIRENSRITRLIPARTANGESILLAIVPERLTLNTGKEQYDAEYLLAISPLCEGMEGFEALIGTD